MVKKKSELVCSECGNDLTGMGWKAGDDLCCIPEQGHYDVEEYNSQVADDLGAERATAIRKKLKKVI